MLSGYKTTKGNEEEKLKTLTHGNIEFCKDKIDALEHRLKSMGASTSSEQEVAKKEFEIFQKYCARLIAVQKENSELKKERDSLKSSLLATVSFGRRENLTKQERSTDRDSLLSGVQLFRREMSSSEGSFTSQELNKIREEKCMFSVDMAKSSGKETKIPKTEAVTTQTVEDTNNTENLQKRVAELEQKLLDADATNKYLRDSLEHLNNVKDENTILRKRTAKLQDISKSQEKELEDTRKVISKQGEKIKQEGDEVRKKLSLKDQLLQEKEKTIEELHKEINNLKRLLILEKTRAEEEANMLKTISSNNVFEINKLKARVNILSAEIDRLNSDLERQRQEHEQTTEKLKAKIEEGESVSAKIKKIENIDVELVTGVARLEKENDLLKKELANMKGKGDEHNKLKEEIKALKQELSLKVAEENKNVRLRQEIGELQSDIERFQKEGEILKKELKRRK